MHQSIISLYDMHLIKGVTVLGEANIFFLISLVNKLVNVRLLYALMTRLFSFPRNVYTRRLGDSPACT